MWKYFTKKHNKEFILSLGLIKSPKLNDEAKLKILYTISNNPEKYYTKKYILKKDGTKRELLVPSIHLKNIQKNILKNVLYGLTPSKYVTSYQKNKTIVDNALPHVGQKLVLKLDIKDYFNNITFEEIYNIFPSTIFPPSLRVLLTKLCTYNDYLPQGAPTSPYISNLVLKNFDNYLGKYCAERNINYTRYSDDLTFSGDFNPYKLTNKVKAYLESIGFNLNTKKKHIIYNNQCQSVTGITVNQKVNISAKYRQDIRKNMYYIQKYGLDNHLKYLGITDKIKYLASLKGRINYCQSLVKNKSVYQIYLQQLEEISH